MEVDRFEKLVARLERESAADPRLYRLKVAALTLLGFGILALLVGAVGFGLVLIIGLCVAVAFSGGAALLLLLKFGKLILLLAIPLWFLARSAVKALFVRIPAPQGREITSREAPALFAALEDMRRRMKGPRFHHVLVLDDMNAAVVQRPAFGLIGWPRNYLLLGLPLLEGLPAEEALAVVAHEYGHLAGSHGQFSAFIYRLRHTWSAIEDHVDHIHGWLGRLVAPLVSWYAPYFNAYTFVLARADEYHADAASAELVGTANAVHALKRVDVVVPLHQRFMQKTFERIDHEAQPPRDLMHRWAAQAMQATADAQARRWLGDALDRRGHVADTHPTLRARLGALSCEGDALHEPPPPVAGESAARTWLGSLADGLRAEFQARWAEQVSEPWSERFAQAQAQRARLAELRSMTPRSADEQLEMLRLTTRLEPQADERAAFETFNAEHADHALGLFLEGSHRLDKEDRTGLALLDRAMTLDPEATKAACERAHAFLVERKEIEAAKAYAACWQLRDDLETQRDRQLQSLGPQDTLVEHAAAAETIEALRAQLKADMPSFISEVFIARRVIPADPSVLQWVMGVRLTWWGRRRGKQQEIVNRLAAADWPLPLVFFTLDGRLAPLRNKFLALADSRLY